jgi:hypothetical protein
LQVCLVAGILLQIFSLQFFYLQKILAIFAANFFGAGRLLQAALGASGLLSIRTFCSGARNSLKLLSFFGNCQFLKVARVPVFYVAIFSVQIFSLQVPDIVAEFLLQFLCWLARALQ